MRLSEYYRANIEGIKKTMERTDITEEKKWYLACTQEAIDDLQRCIDELTPETDVEL